MHCPCGPCRYGEVACSITFTPCGKRAGLRSRDPQLRITSVLTARPVIIECSIVAKPKREQSHCVICHRQVPEEEERGGEVRTAKPAWGLQSSVSITSVCSGHFSSNLPRMPRKETERYQVTVTRGTFCEKADRLGYLPPSTFPGCQYSPFGVPQHPE